MRSVGISCGLLITMLSLSQADTYQLTHQGKPACSIIIASQPTPSARLAAKEIQFHLRRMAGVEVPIVSNVEKVIGTRILVGESPATRELGITANDFGPQEYAILARPNTIVLIGRDWHPSQADSERDGIPMSGGDSLPATRHRIDYAKAVEPASATSDEFELPGIYDEQGTCQATYDFLERLGIRWYGPSSVSIIIPENKTVDVSLEDVRRSPDLKLRCGLASGNWPFMQKQWGSFSSQQVQLHWRRSRLGGERWSGNHTFHRQTIAQAFTDPQYQSRNLLGKGSQLCYSNPVLIEKVAQMARDYFDGKDNLPPGWKALGDYFTIVPDDNSHFCTCDECQPLLREGYDHRTLCFNTGKASNYWFTFVNAVAREVRKTHPDKYIATLAYWLYAVPPDFDLEPNVSIAPCMITCAFPVNSLAESNDMKIYRDWTKKTDAPMFMWIYYHQPMEPALIQGWKCFPHVMVHKTAEYSRTFIRDGLRGIYVCGEQDMLEQYVMTKVWDDADTNVDQVIEEFFSLYFGAAKEPMQKFYARLEEISCDRTNYPTSTFKNDLVDWRAVSWTHLGTAERMRELGSLILQAEQKAITPDEKQRVALWRSAYWDWMREGYQQHHGQTPPTGP